MHRRRENSRHSCAYGAKPHVGSVLRSLSASKTRARDAGKVPSVVVTTTTSSQTRHDLSRNSFESRCRAAHERGARSACAPRRFRGFCAYGASRVYVRTCTTNTCRVHVLSSEGLSENSSFHLAERKNSLAMNAWVQYFKSIPTHMVSPSKIGREMKSVSARRG